MTTFETAAVCAVAFVVVLAVVGKAVITILSLFSAPWNPIACLLPPLLVIIHDEVTGHNSLGPVVHHVLDRLLCLLACQLMWNRRKKTKAQALGYICRLVIKKKKGERGRGCLLIIHFTKPSRV